MAFAWDLRVKLLLGVWRRYDHLRRAQRVSTFFKRVQ